MAQLHIPSLKRATLIYLAAAGVWFWAGTHSGKIGHPPRAAVGMMIVAMVAGPVAAINFWNILWGSFTGHRSIFMFIPEILYSAILPGAFFAFHVMRYLHKI